MGRERLGLSGMIKEAHRSRIWAEELAALHRKWELDRQARDEAEERRRRETSDRWIKTGQLLEYVGRRAVGSSDREETPVEFQSQHLSR